jgi:4-hydroxy-tetrahydrodipicolinate synthase
MRKAQFPLNGLVVPVPTPFDDEDAIDFGAYLSHLDWLAECGVRNILVNGTTGEFFSLTREEQMQLLRVSRENWKGNLIYHLSTPSLFQALENVHAIEEAGADFIACLPPFYFANAPAEGLIDWFTRLSIACDLPLILYNFPRHTNNALTTELLKEIPHWGLKDSSGDLSLIPSTPNYFVGGDKKISEAYATGAKGFVSASSNIDPKPYVRIENAQTPETQDEVNAVNDRARGPFAIANIKRELSEILPGYPANLRPPLTPAPGG